MRRTLQSLLWLLLPVLALAAPPPRSAEDIERDARDKPQEILAFAGVAPGMHVADLFAGGGYWSELLQAAVGDEGHVLLYNNAGYAKYGAEALEARFAEGRLRQIEQRVAPTDAMGLGEATLDRAIMVMAFHDLYWVDEKQGWPAIDRDAFIAQAVAALKPGGALLIVDHAAVAGSGTDAVNTLHRIDEAFVQATLEKHGLKLESTSPLLRQSGDDHGKHVFDKAIQGRTDRFVQLYRKPAAKSER
jgi:predicted methyltransferase